MRKFSSVIPLASPSQHPSCPPKPRQESDKRVTFPSLLRGQARITKGRRDMHKSALGSLSGRSSFPFRRPASLMLYFSSRISDSRLYQMPRPPLYFRCVSVNLLSDKAFQLNFSIHVSHSTVSPPSPFSPPHPSSLSPFSLPPFPSPPHSSPSPPVMSRGVWNGDGVRLTTDTCLETH